MNPLPESTSSLFPLPPPSSSSRVLPQSECRQEEGGASAGEPSERGHLPANHEPPVGAPPPGVVGGLGEDAAPQGPALPVPPRPRGPGENLRKTSETVTLET